MATKKQRQAHLMAVLVGNVGASKAYRVALFIGCWGICMKALGRPPANVEEYADWWKKSRATCYREQEIFRYALPMHSTPSAICEWLAEEDARVFAGSPTEVAFKVGAALS